MTTPPAVSRLDRERIATLTLRAVFDPLAMLHNTEARSRRDHAHLRLTNLLGTLPRDEWPTHIAIYQDGAVGFLDPAADGVDAAEHLTPGRTTTITELVLEEPELDADTIALNLEADQLYATYDDVVGAWPEHADVWRAVALKARQLYRSSAPAADDTVRNLIAGGLIAFQHTREYLGEQTLPAIAGWSWYDWTVRAEAFLASAAPSPDPTVPHGFDMNPIPAERGICDRCRCGKEVRDPIHYEFADHLVDISEELPNVLLGAARGFADDDGPPIVWDLDSMPTLRIPCSEGDHVVHLAHVGADLDEPKDPDDDLVERVTELERGLHNHITVPSWWNKRTDARLAKLEEIVNIPGPDDDEPNLVEQLLWQHTAPPFDDTVTAPPSGPEPAPEPELTGAEKQTELIANYIAAEVPGEPSRSEGVGACAVRIIRDSLARIAQLEADLDAAQLRSIEARNPGIDMDQVKATRQAMRAPRDPRSAAVKPEATADGFSFWRAEDAVVTVTATSAVPADHVDERVARYIEQRKAVGDRVESWHYNQTTGTLSFRVRLATPANLQPYAIIVDPEQYDEILNLLPPTPRGWFVVPGPITASSLIASTPPGGVADIAAERADQIKRWGLDHDDEHELGELGLAALCYLQHARYVDRVDDATPPPWWPFEPESWHPSHDPIRELVKAGALIAAEIDRRRRAQA